MDIKKTLLTIIIIFTSLNLVYSLSIEELITSYTYDHNTPYNITKITNLETNTSLIFNINTDYYNLSHKVKIILDDKYPITKIENLSSKNISIIIPKYILNKNQYNYTITINDKNKNLKYRKTNLQTIKIKNKNQQYTIDKATLKDSNNLNKSINITFQINNITTFSKIPIILLMKSENNKTIKHLEYVNLINKTQTVTLQIPKSKIFKSQNLGKYNINLIKLDKKAIELNYTTEIYDYKYFSNISFINDISIIKPNILNLSLSIKENGDYNIEVQIFDKKNPLKVYSEIKYLTTNNNSILIEIPLYDLVKYNKNITIKNIKLSKDNNTLNIFKKNLIIEEINSSKISEINLPNLEIYLDALFNKTTNQSTLIINAKNTGDQIAYNIPIDIFSESRLPYTKNLFYLKPNEFKQINITFKNSTINEIFKVYLDIKNLILETNESDNFNSITSKGIPKFNISYEIKKSTKNEFELITTNMGKGNINTTLTIIIDNKTNITKTLHVRPYSKTVNQINLNLTKGNHIFKISTLNITKEIMINISDFLFNINFNELPLNYIEIEINNQENKNISKNILIKLNGNIVKKENIFLNSNKIKKILLNYNNLTNSSENNLSINFLNKSFSFKPNFKKINSTHIKNINLIKNKQYKVNIINPSNQTILMNISLNPNNISIILKPKQEQILILNQINKNANLNIHTNVININDWIEENSLEDINNHKNLKASYNLNLLRKNNNLLEDLSKNNQNAIINGKINENLFEGTSYIETPIQLKENWSIEISFKPEKSKRTMVLLTNQNKNYRNPLGIKIYIRNNQLYLKNGRKITKINKIYENEVTNLTLTYENSNFNIYLNSKLITNINETYKDGENLKIGYHSSYNWLKPRYLFKGQIYQIKIFNKVIN